MHIIRRFKRLDVLAKYKLPGFAARNMGRCTDASLCRWACKHVPRSALNSATISQFNDDRSDEALCMYIGRFRCLAKFKLPNLPCAALACSAARLNVGRQVNGGINANTTRTHTHVRKSDEFAVISIWFGSCLEIPSCRALAPSAPSIL